MTLFDRIGNTATLAIIKPEAFNHRQDILRTIRQHGFIIGPHNILQLKQRQAEEFYAEHEQKSFFADYIRHMCSGPVLTAVLRNEPELDKRSAAQARPPYVTMAADTWYRWRQLMGPYTDPPAGTIRALYGTSVTMNAVHGSDSHTAAQREILFFFSLATIINYVESAAVRAAHVVA